MQGKQIAGSLFKRFRRNRCVSVPTHREGLVKLIQLFWVVMVFSASGDDVITTMDKQTLSQFLHQGWPRKK